MVVSCWCTDTEAFSSRSRISGVDFRKVISAWVVFARGFAAPLSQLPVFLNQSVVVGFFSLFEM